MATTAREWLQFVPEPGFGVPPTFNGGTLPTGGGYIRLDQSNAFQVRPNVASINVPFGGGVPIPAQRVPGTISMTGTLNTILTYQQVQTLLPWAITNVTGPSGSPANSPWPTSIAPGDLASMSLYHTIRTNSGETVQRCYRGCKVSQLQITCSDDQPLCRGVFTIMASKPYPNTTFGGSDPLPTTEFIPPDYTKYPTDFLHFWHTRSNILIGTASPPPARTMYRSLSLTFRNQVVTRYYESQWPSVVEYVGRESRVEFRSVYLDSLNDRSDYESNLNRNVQIGFANPETPLPSGAAPAVKIKYHGKNRIDTPPADDLPIDNVYEQTITLLNYLDASITDEQPDVNLGFTLP